MDIKVKTLFQGQIAIRDKYIKKAERTGEDILIFHDNQVMEIQNKDIRPKALARSRFQVRDKYSKESHYLFYYKWLPTKGQKTLNL